MSETRDVHAEIEQLRRIVGILTEALIVALESVDPTGRGATQIMCDRLEEEGGIFPWSAR